MPVRLKSGAHRGASQGYTDIAFSRVNTEQHEGERWETR